MRRRVFKSWFCHETMLVTYVNSLGHDVLSRKVAHPLAAPGPVSGFVESYSLFSPSRVWSQQFRPCIPLTIRDAGIVLILHFMRCLAVKDEPLIDTWGTQGIQVSFLGET